MNQLEKRLAWSLLTLRLSVFIVMLMWALDKWINPGHTAAVFDNFYGISGLGEMAAAVLGGLQIILCILFVLGVAKFLTYGIIFILHGVSTLSSYAQYLDAFNNLLFLAAWPMWAACFTLFVMRDHDRFTLGGTKS